MSSDFWKERYKDSWDKAAQKEKMIVDLLELKTGKKVELVGLGAGTTDYLTGNASDNNSVKGDADLYIRAVDFFVEVTGPNIKVYSDAPLWVRPDKIQNALEKTKNDVGKGHFVIHIIERKDDSTTLIRVVPIAPELLNLPIIHPFIRGQQETYVEIPTNYKTVITIEAFIEMIK